MILVMSLVEPIGDSADTGAPQSMKGLLPVKTSAKQAPPLETWVLQLIPSPEIRSQSEEVVVPDEL